MNAGLGITGLNQRPPGIDGNQIGGNQAKPGQIERPLHSEPAAKPNKLGQPECDHKVNSAQALPPHLESVMAGFASSQGLFR